jgi:hypothetical protein
LATIKDDIGVSNVRDCEACQHQQPPIYSTAREPAGAPPSPLHITINNTNDATYLCEKKDRQRSFTKEKMRKSLLVVVVLLSAVVVCCIASQTEGDKLEDLKQFAQDRWADVKQVSWQFWSKVKDAVTDEQNQKKVLLKAQQAADVTQKKMQEAADAAQNKVQEFAKSPEVKEAAKVAKSTADQFLNQSKHVLAKIVGENILKAWGIDLNLEKDEL